MSLSDAVKALEIVDAYLTAVQSNPRLDPGIVDLLDLVIGDVRGAAADVASHTCPIGQPIEPEQHPLRGIGGL